MSRPWSGAELALVADQALSRTEVARITGRSVKAVWNQASRQGQARTVLTRCPPDTLAALSDPALAFAEIADRTGLSLNEIEYRRRLLGVPRRVEWADYELALVDDLSLTYDEVAAQTGRSRMAVKLCAQRRGAHRRVFWSEPGYQPGSDSYRGEDWPKVKASVLDRDGYVCQEGGEFFPSGRGLVVHHMIPYRLRPSNDQRWLVTLCRSHHALRSEHHWASIPEDVILFLAEGR